MLNLLLIYVFIGLIFTLLEFRTFDFKELNKAPSAIQSLVWLQFVVHLFRYWMTWPLYVIEDACLALQVWILGEDADE